MLMIAFLNGRFVPETQALISVNDRGFTYGDGLFETIRVIHGRLFQMTSHLERLKRGAEFLKISSPFGMRVVRTDGRVHDSGACCAGLFCSLV